MNMSMKSLIGTFAGVFVLYTAFLDPLLTLILAVILISLLFVLQFAIGSKAG